MATITTDTYLDGGTARTAGEAWTCNGGRLTIRTDSRWHANSPASMTGSLGSVAISATLGGGYTIDARSVRWMAYDGGSGNVPAIGTTVTGGTSGATGYLLGVWSSLTASPTPVGNAMPASGFLKFREVTGAFVDNDQLSGLNATANGVDKVGWIEVVHDQATAITVPRLGDFTVRGDWFDLGTTTGTANQLVQLPTNGSTTTYGLGLWIANTDTPTTDNDYDFYPALYAAGMNTTNLGTDERSKFVCMETDGRLRIGHNGTTTVGYVPPAGRAIRTPNVFMRQCTTAARATNAIPHATVGTRPDFTTTSAGIIDWDHCSCDWYAYFLQPYSVRLENVALERMLSLNEVASALDIYDVGIATSATADSVSLTLLSCFAGGTIEKGSFQRYSTGSNDHAVSIQYCIGQTFTNCKSGIITYARTTSGTAFYATQCSDLVVNNHTKFNGQMTFNTSFDCTINNIDHCDRYVGSTNTTSGIYALALTNNCANCIVDGVTFGLNGAISDCHPYLGIFNESAGVNNRFRNVGTRSSFISGGSTSNPAYIYVSAGNNVGTKVQRVYMAPTRTGAISTLNSDKGQTFEHVYGDMGDNMVVAALNATVRNCGGTNTTAGQASVYGTHFWDAFTGDTTGRVILSLNEDTTETNNYVTTVAGTPKFTSAGNLSMPTLNDEVIIEQHYFVKGCTGLTNTAPIITGTNVAYSSGASWGNHDIYYQIDTGSGWNGSWKDLNASNLSSESITADTGFKLKYRIVCATSAATNLLTYIRIATDSLLSSQASNLYPLEVVPITVTVVDKNNNPIQNAQTAVYRTSDDMQLMNEDTNASGVATENVEYSSDTAIYVRVRKSSDGNTRYYPASTVGTLTSTGYTTTIAMIEDTTV